MREITLLLFQHLRFQDWVFEKHKFADFFLVGINFPRRAFDQLNAVGFLGLNVLFVSGEFSAIQGGLLS